MRAVSPALIEILVFRNAWVGSAMLIVLFGSRGPRAALLRTLPPCLATSW